MSHEASTSPERDAAREGLREVPGDKLARGPLLRLWDRLRLAPLLALLGCVTAATVVGGTTQAELDRAAAMPPATAGASAPVGEAGAVCAPARPAIPDAQPWQGDARAGSEAIYEASTASLQGPVIEGRDGWLFWSDYQWQNFSQGLGRRVQSVAEMDAWSAHYQGIADELEAKGIPFAILIAPAKWDAYRGQLPEWADGIQGSTTFDYLRAAHPELPLVDVRDAVAQGAAQADTYERDNSHWTPYGGYVAWEQTARCLASLGGDFAGIAAPPISGVATEQGNSEFAVYGFEPSAPGLTVPVFAEAPGPMTLVDKDGRTHQLAWDYPTDMLEMPATTLTPNAQSSARALVLRDSFGGAIAPGLQAAFAETTQVSHGIGSEAPADILALAEEEQPDVVILELTERYLHFIPGQGELTG